MRARTPQRGLRMAFLALLLGAPRFSCRCKGEDKWGLSTTKWRFKLRAGRALHFQLVPRLFPKTRRGRNFEQGERYIASREQQPSPIRLINPLYNLMSVLDLGWEVRGISGRGTWEIGGRYVGE